LKNSSKKNPIENKDNSIEKKHVALENIYFESLDTDDFANLPPNIKFGLKRKTPLVNKNKDLAVLSKNVLSNKRATKKAKKLTEAVEVLNRGVSPHGHRAWILRDYMLSKSFREKYKEKEICNFFHG